MGKKFLSLFLSLSLMVSMPIAVPTRALESTIDINKEQVIDNLNKLSNGKLKISEEDGQVFISGKLSDKLIAGEKSSAKFLDENKSLFKIDNIKNDLKAVIVDGDELGYTHVKYVQVINGVEVEGGFINVHFDDQGVLVSVSGKLKENKNVEKLGNAKISDIEAIEIAKSQYSFNTLREDPKVENIIFSKDDINYEVYKVNISFFEPTIGNYDVYIEAYSGEIINIENRIRHNTSVLGSGIGVLGNVKSLNLYQSGSLYYMKDISKPATTSIDTYSMRNGTTTGHLVSNTTNYFGEEAHKASVSAHYYSGRVIEFYKNLFNRNSLDNNGMAIRSFTNYGSNYNNAFWTGYEMVYGDGDGTLFTYLSGDLDVVGHEMTHGLIEYTANLAYRNQSGALNESIADVFGVLIATYYKYGVASGGNWVFNANDWVIGDDIYTPNIPGDAIRSLSNPALYGQPDHMSKYKYLPDTEAGDFGGVHINSGIPSKAAFNLANSVGMEKTARIFYRALVNYMSPSTNFEGARNSLVQAATDLYGGSSVEVVEVGNAFYSVGVGQAPTAPKVTSRLGGANRIETSTKIADSFRGSSKLNGVILANASNFPDALAGGVLTKKYNAPILLANKTSTTSKDTIDYIKNNVNKDAQIVILGSIGAIDGTVVSALEDAGFSNIKRLGGVDRFATNMAIINDFNPTVGSDVIVSYSHNFPDALSISSVSAAKGMPILLVNGKLTDQQKNMLSKVKPSNIYITGGTGVIPSTVESELKKYSSSVMRLGGSNRYETSRLINEKFKSVLTGPNALLASGLNFPDALSGTALALKLNAPIVLVNAKDTSIQKEFISKNNKTNIYVLGGTGSISNASVKAITD